MSTVQSVERAFAVLQSLASGPAGVSEVAERCGLPKSTVARLLSTLVEVGAVEQSDALGVYGLGSVLIDLASAASPGNSLISITHPHLVDLVAQTGEAAGLSMLDGFEVYYYDQVDGDHEVQVRDWTGESVDAQGLLETYLKSLGVGSFLNVYVCQAYLTIVGMLDKQSLSMSDQTSSRCR